MILQIDVTVAGPDSVMTGSVAVTVIAPGEQPAEEDLNLRMRQRSQSMRWGGGRA